MAAKRLTSSVIKASSFNRFHLWLTVSASRKGESMRLVISVQFCQFGAEQFLGFSLNISQLKFAFVQLGQ